MIDNISIEQTLENLPKEIQEKKNIPFEWKGIIFKPIFSKDGIVIYYRAEWRNLFLKIRWDKFTITNSIHKFYHGNNYSVFTIHDFREAIKELSSQFKLDFTKAKVKKIEYGCNLSYRKPDYLIDSLISYRRGRFVSMLKRAKSYGRKQISTDYEIKMYNKKKETWLHYGRHIRTIVRFEKKIINMRYLRGRGINISFVDDLLKKKTWEALSLDLIETFSEILKSPDISLDKLSPEQLKELAVVTNEEIGAHMKRKHPRTYSRYKKKTSRIGISSEYLKFQNKLENKCELLIR